MTLDGIIFMESSGVIREAFRARGMNVYSCDLLPADDGSPHHFQGDCRKVIKEHKAGFFGFHPMCKFLCVSGLHWNDRGRGWEGTDAALGFVLWCMSHTDTPYYLENPRGIISTMIRRPDQEIQPYQFGDDASKLTCLWLNKVPPLRIDPAQRKAGRMVLHNGKMVERWANQTDSGQNRLAPSETRWKERSRSYPGIAAAMAAQWGNPAELALTA
jgi:hypothetical protein